MSSTGLYYDKNTYLCESGFEKTLASGLPPVQCRVQACIMIKTHTCVSLGLKRRWSECQWTTTSTMSSSGLYYDKNTYLCESGFEKTLVSGQPPVQCRVQACIMIKTPTCVSLGLKRRWSVDYHQYNVEYRPVL